MEKQALKFQLDALRNTSSAESIDVVVNAEYNETFSSNEWFNEIIPLLRKSGMPDGNVQLLLTLCRYCQTAFHSDRVDIEVDLKKRIADLGNHVVEYQDIIKQHPQYAGVIYAGEAAFYLYTASVSLRAKKSRQQTSRPSLENCWSLITLSYDLTKRAESHFIEIATTPSTVESKILAQAIRLNALNLCIAAALLIDRLKLLEQSNTSVEGPWLEMFPNMLTESQTCLKKTLDLRDDSRILTTLCYSAPNAMMNSNVPSLSDLLHFFEHVLTTSLDLHALTWSIILLRRLFPVSKSTAHQYTDAFIIDALVKGQVSSRTSQLPSTLAGEFSSPSADALCQLDIIGFILMAAARVEVSMKKSEETFSDILPPFACNYLGNNELGGDIPWLTTSQLQWWRAVMTPNEKGKQAIQDPFAKFRLIQDGLFLLRLSGMDAKLAQMALRVAETLQSFVYEHYFNSGHHDSTTISTDIRRFHVYCCKYWNTLQNFVHNSRSGSHSHHNQRISLGGSAPPSRQQRFFDPLPGGLMDSFSGGSISSEMRNQIILLSNCYLGFDALLTGSYETSVKMFKACSNEIILAGFFEGKAFEAMAEESIDKNARMSASSASSTWVIRQLYESALSAYEKALNYTQSGFLQVQRTVVIDAANKGASRIKKKLLGSKRDETSVQRVVTTLPVNGEPSVEPTVPHVNAAVSQQQQQALNMIQQQQEQSLNVLNNTVGQLVPAIRDLSSAARDLADVAHQLRDLERQLRESVVRMECSIQQQAQRPTSSATTATPPVPASSAGGITADQLLPLLTDLIRERNSQVQFMSPNIMPGQPNMMIRPGFGSIADQLPPGIIPTALPFGSIPPPSAHQNLGSLDRQFPQNCAVATQNAPHIPSAFSPVVSGDVKPIFPSSQQQPHKVTPIISSVNVGQAKPSEQSKPTLTVPQQTMKPAEKSLADMFKPAPGSWSCKLCLVRNKESDTKCVACEQLKPGASPSTNQGPVSKPLPQINFGLPASSKPQNSQSSSGAPLFSKLTGNLGTIQFGSTSSSSSAPAEPTCSTQPAAPSKPIFGNQSAPVFEPTKVTGPPKNQEGAGDEETESPEEFVPTIEYNPVAELPSNYEVVTGEENEERLFSNRAKLYRWADNTKEWKERGVGEMKVLKNTVTRRCRILMRREQVLKPCANHYITAKLELLPFTAVADRGFRWLAADFAEVEAGEEPEILQLAVRFRNSEVAAEFKKAVDSCREFAQETMSPVKPSQPVGVVTEKQQTPPVQKTVQPTVENVAKPAATQPSTVFTQPTNLPQPVFGSSFLKKPETSTEPMPFGSSSVTTTGSGGLFSFAALAASQPKSDSAADSKPAPFVGAPEPLFKSLLSKTGQPETTSSMHTTNEAGTEEEQPECFIPTAEYAPVVQLPNAYKLVSGEEGFEKVFSERCKLYRFDSSSKEWKERGLGDIRLIKATDGSMKCRIVMRREHIHTVCANHYLTVNPSMRLGRLPSAADKAVTWFAANDYSDGEAKMETLCARFKSAAIADNFSSSFKNCLDDLEEKYGLEGKTESSPPRPDSQAKPAGEKTTTSGTSATTTASQPTTTSATPQFASLFSSTAPKASPAADNVTPFSGFRFGQLGAASTGTPSSTPVTTAGALQSPFTTGMFSNASKPAAPGGFSFTGVFPSTTMAAATTTTTTTTTATTTTTEKPANKGTQGDDDCQLVRTENATADEVAKARQFLLPDDFYLYRLRKPCGGCPGCDDNNDDRHADESENNENFSSISQPSSNKNKSACSKPSARTFKSQIPSPSFPSR